MKVFAVSLFLSFCTVSQAQWARIQNTSEPPARYNVSAVHDVRGNRIIIFGGRSSTMNYNDVWSFSLSSNSWSELTPTSGSAPAPRFTQNAMFDSLKNRMIIWSGQGTELFNDVWAFNFSSNSWEQLWADGNVSGAPLKRYGTAAIFDKVNRWLVTFAGFTTSGRFEDMWYFQVDSLRWVERTNDPHPELRCLHAGTYIKDQQKMIIYGGQHNGYLDDIWSLDLNTFAWSNITPAVKPAGRLFAPVASLNGGNIILFGGQTAAGDSGELWRFSLASNSWREIEQQGIRPSARNGHALVYIPGNDKLFVFGGSSTGTSLNDTWIYSGIGSTGIMPLNNEVPGEFSLEQNYPNPFNPSTEIRFSLPRSGNVKLAVYDINGKLAAVLTDEDLNAGSYQYTFNGSGMPSGVYFYRLEVQGKFIQSRKMLLVK